ncbi:MAG: PilZ domain-containing protein [Treponema sp.]|jgi:hypothetical protein|nr:PilZ domain-containing protein [Treponema sp.]
MKKQAGEVAAAVGIDGFHAEVQIKNLSEKGFSILSAEAPALEPGARCRITITPAPESGLASFEAPVVVRWLSFRQGRHSTGFFVEEPSPALSAFIAKARLS